jgi:hypothetical protein
VYRRLFPALLPTNPCKESKKPMKFMFRKYSSVSGALKGKGFCFTHSVAEIGITEIMIKIKSTEHRLVLMASSL